MKWWETYKKTALAWLCGCWMVGAHAVPAYNGLLTHIQPDGTKVSYYLKGDERLHAFYSPDGYMLRMDEGGALRYVTSDAEGNLMMSQTCIAHDAPQRTEAEQAFLETIATPDFDRMYRKQLAKSSPLHSNSRTDFPTIGRLKGLVLLVEFADNAFSAEHTVELFNRQMNEKNFSSYGGTGSVRDYFLAQSMERFDPSFDVVGPVKLSKKMADYGENTSFGGGYDRGAINMVTEACKLADEQYDTDFSQYDADNNGVVDFVYIIYAGYGESYGAPSYTIWPHSADLEDFSASLTLDGKRINRYACSCELKYTSGNILEGIGTFCHEFSHVLGLPDFYQTNGGGVTQLGVWSVMESGNYNNESRTPAAYSAFERYSLGWLDFTDIDTPAMDLELLPVTESNKAYRLTTKDADEYFVLENRQQKGWDTYLPASGLMITHVDYDKGLWNANAVNNDATHPRYKLMAADNSAGISLEGDLFPGSTENRSFTDATLPSSLAWDGTPTNKAVTNIRNADGKVLLDFMQNKLATPIWMEPQELTKSSFVACWEEVANARNYMLTVREDVPDSTRLVLVDEDFSGMQKGNYPQADEEDIAGQLDAHTHQAGWTGTAVFQAGGSCRLGDYGVSGKLMTPPLHLSATDGTCTVGFYAQPYPGKGVNYEIMATDLITGKEIGKMPRKIKGGGEYVVVSFAGTTAQTALSITTKNERLYLSHFRVLRGEVDSAQVWTTEDPNQVIEGITDTRCEVMGLAAGRSYLCTVQALSGDPLCNSDASDVLKVTLPGKSAISENLIHSYQIKIIGRTLHISAPESPTTWMIADTLGRTIRSGTMCREATVTLPADGLYVVQIGNAVQKILVRTN